MPITPDLMPSSSAIVAALSASPLMYLGAARVGASLAESRARQRLADWARSCGAVILSCETERVDRSPFWLASSRACVFHLAVRDAQGDTRSAWACVDGRSSSPDEEVLQVLLS